MTALMLLLGTAAAQRIEIDTGGDPQSRLEIRQVVLPGGEEAELYVLQGSPVTVTIDQDRLVAEEIEVDLTNRLVRVIGFGTLTTPEQTLQGEDLVIELDEETAQGSQVLIVTDAIDVIGAEAVRVPGQVSVQGAAFSPCSRCAQQVEDFGFRAERLELYPGDRLVAFEVEVLVRGRELARLPLLVVPLGPAERQPRLALSRGTVTEPAEVALDWPYVAGPNAYGTFSVRYLADVDPGAGGLAAGVLGGAVAESYLGGGVDHRFFDERGRGRFSIFYRPPLLDPELPGGRERPGFTALFSYQSAEALEGGVPVVDIEVRRDDESRDRLVEYRVALADELPGVDGVFESQGFVDLEPGDGAASPSYDGRLTPRRTLARLALEPTDPDFGAGPLFVRRLLLDLGMFEDSSNPTNRSAARFPLAEAGRLLGQYELELPPYSPWPGMLVSGGNFFRGQYYTTGERLVDWDTRILAEQRLWELGELELRLLRDVTEGETPFRFDQLPLRERTEVAAALRLEPLRWLTIEVEEGYVFRDSRNPELEGLQPLETSVLLFDDLHWVDLAVANRYDIAEGDPGTLAFALELRTPGSQPAAELAIRHVEDLLATPSRLTGEAVDESATTVELAYGSRWLRLDAAGGYVYRPTLEEGEPAEHWLPFELGLAVGTLEQGDRVPGLRLAYVRDLNRHEVSELGYEATARLGPVELRALQRFDLPEGAVAESLLEAEYPGVAELSLRGFALLRPGWLGLPRGEPRETRYSVTLRDSNLSGGERWQVRYQTAFDPRLATPAGGGGFEGSMLDGRLLLADVVWGSTRVALDAFAELQLPDDRTSDAYLRRASVVAAADLGGRVGIQGAVGYRASYSPTLEEVTRAELRIEELALTVRALDDLYVGAIVDDVWDLTGNTPSERPFNFQPELFAVWDRCCWALSTSWDTATGEVTVAITAPGSRQGLIQEFDTPLLLPGRQEP